MTRITEEQLAETNRGHAELVAGVREQAAQLEKCQAAVAEIAICAAEWRWPSDRPTTEVFEEWAKQAAAIREVRGVHVPVAALDVGARNPQWAQVCAGCGQDDGNWSRWPCRTITVLGGVGS